MIKWTPCFQTFLQILIVVELNIDLRTVEIATNFTLTTNCRMIDQPFINKNPNLATNFQVTANDANLKVFTSYVDV